MSWGVLILGGAAVWALLCIAAPLGEGADALKRIAAALEMIARDE